MIFPNLKKLGFRFISLFFLAAVSLSSLDKNTAFAQSLDLNKVYAEIWLSQGIQQYRNGRFGEAIASLQQALGFYQSLGDANGLARSLDRLGDSYFSLGQYEQSLVFYQQSLQFMQSLKDRRGEAEVLLNLSNASLNLGEAEDAKKYQQQAEQVRREYGNPTREAAFLGNLGLTDESDQKYQQALEFYQQQLGIAREVNNALLEVDALGNLARVYETLGKYELAMQYRQELLAKAELTEVLPVQAISLNQLGRDATANGNLTEAIAFYQQQLTLAQKTGDRTSAATARNPLAQAYEQAAQYPQAIELRQQQLAEAQAQGDRLATGKLYNQLGSNFLKSQNFTEAQKNLQAALKTWSDLRSQLGNNLNYTSEQTKSYQLLQQVFIAQNQPETALEIAEQSKLRNLLDLLGLRLATEPVGTGLKAAPRSLFSPTLTSIKQTARSQKATLVSYSIISETQLYAWVIQPTGNIAFRLIDIPSQSKIYPVSSLKNLVESSLQALNSPAANQPLLQLHQILIQPLEDLLPKDPTNRIIFVPEGELLFVPFAALRDITGTYLIQKHTLVTTPSIPLLAVSRQHRLRVVRARRGVPFQTVAMGNPIMPRLPSSTGTLQPLAPLTHAEQETLEIGAFFKITPLIGDRATKAAFLQLLPTAKRLHLATYGLLNGRGGIALAPSGADNGILTSGEILNLPFLSELAVISAGNPNPITSEGVASLSTALIAAGVPSVVFSLTTGDEATAYLMPEFYRQLRQNRDKAQALRQSILQTLKQYPNSRSWGGLQFMGEAR